MLTLNDVFLRPENFTTSIKISDNESAILRPLIRNDSDELAIFLESLSTYTRKFYTYDSFDINMANSLCADINRYDKLRFVLESVDTKQIIGIFEFSMDLVEEDLKRYMDNGYKLDPKTTCRFGPALADEYQGKGIARKVFSFMVEIAKKFGREQIILFGGVKSENINAIKFYKSVGFKKIGSFINSDGIECLDMIYIIKQ